MDLYVVTVSVDSDSWDEEILADSWEEAKAKVLYRLREVGLDEGVEVLGIKLAKV